MATRRKTICDDCDAAGYEDGELFPTYCRIVNDTVTYIHRGRCPFKDNIVVNKGSEFEWRESLGDNYAE